MGGQEVTTRSAFLTSFQPGVATGSDNHEQIQDNYGQIEVTDCAHEGCRKVGKGSDALKHLIEMPPPWMLGRRLDLAAKAKNGLGPYRG